MSAFFSSQFSWYFSSLFNRFAKAYGYKKPIEGDVNEATQYQG